MNKREDYQCLPEKPKSTGKIKEKKKPIENIGFFCKNFYCYIL